MSAPIDTASNERASNDRQGGAIDRGPTHRHLAWQHAMERAECESWFRGGGEPGPLMHQPGSRDRAASAVPRGAPMRGSDPVLASRSFPGHPRPAKAPGMLGAAATCASHPSPGAAESAVRIASHRCETGSAGLASAGRVLDARPARHVAVESGPAGQEAKADASSLGAFSQLGAVLAQACPEHLPVQAGPDGGKSAVAPASPGRGAAGAQLNGRVGLAIHAAPADRPGELTTPSEECDESCPDAPTASASDATTDERAPIRWHTELSEQGLCVWLGVDADVPVESLVPLVLRTLAPACAQGRVPLARLVCNGRELWAAEPTDESSSPAFLFQPVRREDP